MKNLEKNACKSGKFVGLVVLLLAVSWLLVGCQSATKKRVGAGATVIESEEGWLNKDTYKMWVAGSWDRNRYYVEGEEEEIDKEPKSMFILRGLSKTAAKVKALRNFKQKMISYVESESQVENDTLVNDVITTSIGGVTIAPQAVKEEYSAKGDANVLYYFTAKGLKQNVDKAVQETVKRYREEASIN